MPTPAGEDPAGMSSGAFPFGKFEVLEELGRGGMGVVYRARQTDLDRPVALKMILANHLASPDAVRRFHAEAQAAAKARHPSVVGVFETGFLQGQHYIAMEFVEGQSLEEVLDDGDVDEATAVRMVSAIARAVDYLHSLGIVHRDLKPSNILVDTEGRPYVTDFGLAKVFGSDHPPSVTGDIVGTPGYMAPEQISGKLGAIGPRTDVYGLGAMLYELGTGRPPFGDGPAMEILLRVLGDEPDRARRLAPALSREYEMVCSKCMARSPRERYPSAKAVADDLDRLLAGEPIEAAPPGIWQRARRFVRQHPALAWRLIAFVAFYSITVANWAAGIDTAAFLARISLILAGWTAASIGLDMLMAKERFAGPARVAWAVADVAAVTAILLIGDGVRSSLLMVYPLLVAAAGLWAKVHMVRFMVVAVAVSYAVLIVESRTRRPELELRADQHLIFLFAIVVLGFLIGHQVRRTRALGRYLQNRVP